MYPQSNGVRYGILDASRLVQPTRAESLLPATTCNVTAPFVLGEGVKERGVSGKGMNIAP